MIAYLCPHSDRLEHLHRQLGQNRHYCYSPRIRRVQCRRANVQLGPGPRFLTGLLSIEWDRVFRKQNFSLHRENSWGRLRVHPYLTLKFKTVKTSPRSVKAKTCLPLSPARQVCTSTHSSYFCYINAVLSKRVKFSGL